MGVFNIKHAHFSKDKQFFSLPKNFVNIDTDIDKSITKNRQVHGPRSTKGS